VEITKINEALREELRAIELSKVNPNHFEFVYNRHFPAIYSYIKSAVADKAIASDLSQDVFYSALFHLDKFNHNEFGIRPWLFGIANNALRMFFRKTKKVMYLPLDDIKLEEFQDVNHEYDLKERRDIVAKFLSQLSIEEQEFIQLRFVAECSFKEIAISIGVSEEACKMRFYRLLEKIRKQIEIR
jgi:RNA polymerase sigma-70 factor (ECF subfamily)